MTTFSLKPGVPPIPVHTERVQEIRGSEAFMDQGQAVNRQKHVPQLWGSPPVPPFPGCSDRIHTRLNHQRAITIPQLNGPASPDRVERNPRDGDGCVPGDGRDRDGTGYYTRSLQQPFSLPDGIFHR